MASQSGPSPNDIGNNQNLHSISPAIFVPTDRDFTKTPPPLSDDPITRMEDTIEALDWHAARVEENMIAMMVQEAERFRREGQIERVQYDTYRRPMKAKDHERGMGVDELRLEESILRRDEGAVRAMLIDVKNRDSREAGASPRTRGPRDPEYVDLETIRKERMLQQFVGGYRQTPRSEALTNILNLVKWGWDGQLEGHRTAIKQEKMERRANLDRQMRETPFLLATTGPPVRASAAPAATSTIPHRRLPRGDPMDIDEP
ncbi:hypothetical protein F5Y14DRAFT_403110 [Nemania sp. NC0429]|nr:hypothetical protein F5Y14DRAFT_403110 [Nemania sp. NC0429]